MRWHETCEGIIQFILDYIDDSSSLFNAANVNNNSLENRRFKPLNLIGIYKRKTQNSYFK